MTPKSRVNSNKQREKFSAQVGRINSEATNAVYAEHKKLCALITMLKELEDLLSNRVRTIFCLAALDPSDAVLWSRVLRARGTPVWLVLKNVMPHTHKRPSPGKETSHFRPLTRVHFVRCLSFNSACASVRLSLTTTTASQHDSCPFLSTWN